MKSEEISDVMGPVRLKGTQITALRYVVRVHRIPLQRFC
jgi:hypothetical protein